MWHYFRVIKTAHFITNIVYMCNINDFFHNNIKTLFIKQIFFYKMVFLMFYQYKKCTNGFTKSLATGVIVFILSQYYNAVSYVVN